jgi:rhodanese-related sulfurtransferase
MLLLGCVSDSKNTDMRYITWDGLEPDKWASIWLIKHHIDPTADVVLRPVGAPTDKGIAFDVPDATYRRTHGVTTYESLRRAYQKDEPTLLELGRIIHDIEITPWSSKTSEYTPAVEQAFRAMQDRFEKRNVPVACYDLFFDRVYSLLTDSGGDGDWESLYDLSDSDHTCGQQETKLASRDDSPFVLRLDTHAVLDQIGAERKIVFVDVREPAEYDEFRIPGAVNLQLRDVRPELKSRFEGADLVIPYCIKDFRGFEMARSLAEIGVKNVGIMQPYGIAGWKHLGLPVTSRGGLSEAEALEKLGQCARSGNCIKSAS